MAVVAVIKYVTVPPPSFISQDFYRPQTKFGQGNIFTGVSLSRGGGWLTSMYHRSHDWGVCLRGGGSASKGEGSASRGTRVCIQGVGQYPPMSAYGRGVRQTPSSPPPKIHGILQDTVNKRAIRILLECILVYISH